MNLFLCHLANVASVKKVARKTVFRTLVAAPPVTQQPKNFYPSISGGGGGSDKSRNRFSVFGNEREEEKNSEEPKIEAQI